VTQPVFQFVWEIISSTLFNVTIAATLLNISREEGFYFIQTIQLFSSTIDLRWMLFYRRQKCFYSGSLSRPLDAINHVSVPLPAFFGGVQNVLKARPMLYYGILHT
jgi:hypothetical protein